ncbi:MAG: hypothetical protein HY475_00090 [Candidatus Terrybacteria bacterium]|nr:hypothetical protein [Candidatus Terrybacteria bacterium]
MPRKYIITAVVLAVIAVVFWTLRSPIPTGEETASPSQRFEEKMTAVGGITVQAQPELLADGNLQFLLQLTAHTGDLSLYDAERNLHLKSGGEELVPLRAENAAGSGPSEHHRELVAIFSAPPNDDFTLALQQLGGDAEATLQWP